MNWTGFNGAICSGARFAVVLLLAAGVVSCRYPQDPRDTLDRATGGVMRVGVIPNPPWTTWEGGEARGLEAQLVRRFAAELGARIEWHPNQGHSVLETLERFGLDLVIGGLTEDDPWQDRVAFTDPYYEAVYVVASRLPVQIDSIDGREVVVEPNTWQDARVREMGGVPVPPGKGRPLTALVVLPEWQLRDGWTATGIEVARANQVMAVPSGENAWFMRLSQFLREEKGAIPGLLHDADPKAAADAS